MHRSRAAAFTLVELLVSMTVSLVLIVALLEIFNSATGTWQRGEAQADAFREARGALQLMARDLAATLQPSYAQPPSGSNAALTAPLLPTLVLNPYPKPDPPPTDATDQQINEELYCLTNIPSPPATAAAASNSGARELCAVGYFCQWLPDVEPYKSHPNLAAPRAYGLMRQYLNGDGTFLRFKAAPETAANTALNFLDVYTRASVTLVPSTPPVDQAQATELAAYVWDLKFRIDTNLVTTDPTYDNGETGAPMPYDHSSPPIQYNGQPPLPPLLPAYVEIRFKALSVNVGRRLEGNAAVTPATWAAQNVNNPIYQTIIRPNAQQFVLRVPLVNGVPPPTP